MIENFMYLLFAHFLADFSLQSDFMSKYKYKLPFVMFVHVTIWTFVLLLTTKILGTEVPATIWIPMFGIHWLCDWYKCDKIEKRFMPIEEHETEVKRAFHLDQGVHILQVFLISLFN